MRINSKISYNELEQLTLILKEKLEGSYLKKIYHYFCCKKRATTEFN